MTFKDSECTAPCMPRCACASTQFFVGASIYPVPMSG